MTDLPGSGSTPQAAAAGLGTADRSGRRMRLLGLAAAVIVVAWLARGVIGPFIVAGVLAYAFWSVVSSLQHRSGLPRAAIIAAGYLVVLGALAVVGVLAAGRIGFELRELTSGGHDVVASAMQKIFGDTIVVAGQTLSTSTVADQVRSAILGLISSPTSAVETATRAVDLGLQVILTLIITFYFLLDGGRFGSFALRFLGRPQRSDALRIAHRINAVLGRWLRGQLLLIALVAAVLYVILGPILHVHYALALAALSGVLEIIPLVGPIIAAALACTVAFSGHGTNTALVVLVVYFVVRQVEDQVVMPLVIGRAVHLHPVVTIFAVLVGLNSWGVLGGLMGVPVAAALNVTLHELFPDEAGLLPEHTGSAFGLPRIPRLPWDREDAAAVDDTEAGEPSSGGGD